jgi:hypothetical protein
VVPVLMRSWYVALSNRLVTRKPPTTQASTRATESKMAGKDPSHAVRVEIARLIRVLR